MKKLELTEIFKYLTDYFRDNAEASFHLKALEKIASFKKEEQLSLNFLSVPAKHSDLKKERLFLYSDGGCRGNPGPGAYAYVVETSDHSLLFEGTGVSSYTTNNQMELLGALEGLKKIRDDVDDSFTRGVDVYSDSKYLVDGMNSWVKGWKARGWKKADKKAPENLELWISLDEITATSFSSVRFFWVKGHAGHPQNERCDQLLNEALDHSFS